MTALKADGKTVVRGTLDAKQDPQTMAETVANIRADAGVAEVFFTPFVKGSVLEHGSDNPGVGFMRTWFFAYSIPAIRDWLFEQHF